MTKETKATKAHRFIDLTPTPEGMAKIMFTLIENGDTDGKRTALAEMVKAFRIAYAYWYPDKYPLDGITGITDKVVKS